MRRKLQRRQRSRRLSRKRQTRRHRPSQRGGSTVGATTTPSQRGGSLPVPPGALVGISTQGEYGVPLLMTREKFEEEKGSLED